MPFVDELASGVAPTSAPDIAAALSLPAGMTAGAMITAFYALAMIEMPLLAWSERVSPRWFSAASLAVLAIASLAAALATGPIALGLALALYGPAAGCSLAVAEGALVESSPAHRERTMARITLAAATGDLAVPVLLAGLAWVDLGWRTAFGVAAALAMMLALSHASEPRLEAMRASAAADADEDPAEGEEGPESVTVGAALRTALGTPSLLGWSMAGVGVGLLDEVLVAFAAVHLAPLGALARSLAFAAWVVGGLAGLAWLERRIDRVSPRRVLLVTTTIATLATLALAASCEPVTASIALALLGASSSTFHPLVKARAYASLPGRPALVNAVAGALVPLDAMAPLVLAAIALGFGDAAAVLALALAPLGIGLAAWRARPDGPPASSGAT